MNNKLTSSLKNIFTSLLFIAGAGLAVCAADVSQKMPWEDPFYAKDISATHADSIVFGCGREGYEMWNEHYAAIEVRIEYITKANKEKLNHALEEVLSSKDREVLKGAVNAGYHYFGSAKIFAQMAKPFAEALLPLQK